MSDREFYHFPPCRVYTDSLAPDLSQRTSFVNPFIIACGTKNAKFTSIAIVCLQRLIVARALPRSKLNQVLEALMQASSAALDVQLKILQALPSLLQNYAAELQGELLVTTLNICFILQSSKNAIVNNTSAATLQQLVVAVFDKVVTEDSMSILCWHEMSGSNMHRNWFQSAIRRRGCYCRWQSPTAYRGPRCLQSEERGLSTETSR